MSAPRPTHHFSTKLLVEAFGSFAIVFFGCGSIIVNEITRGAIGNIGISLTFGLVVMILIGSFIQVSGAHFNPAVTVGLLILDRFPIRAAAPYVCSQIAGGFLAAWVLKLSFDDIASLGATLPMGSQMQSLAIEFLMTLLLILVIAVATTNRDASRYLVAFAVGAAIAFGAYVAGPISGGSMNPARSIGPSVLTGHLSTLWIYIIGPFGGAAFGAYLFKLIKRLETP